ncbi:amidohydrolase family protein [Nocardia sp. alder85J]|uniref:amidohydrolase family protein n=1 Tax=Nocardia sp. alder85J TaxID=2862949 RepID=UPI001CD6443D|nr:amidohydrolase family protein [Nocardia sp. alder85J]MCX4095174.1 cytosine deaminase [Nocardia sp. alder85J]
MEHPLPHRVSRLCGAMLPDGSVVDVQLRHDRDSAVVAAVTPHRRNRAVDTAADEVDLRGYVLLTAPAEPHAHLDKALSWDLLSPPLGDLGAAIRSWRAGSAAFTEESFHERALAAAMALLRNGTTAVRTHVDLLDGPDPLRGLRAVVAVRERLRALMDVQIVVLTPIGAPAERVHAALDAGADFVGGAPHIAPDPVAETDRLLAIAEQRGVGADLHVDEFLDGDHLMLGHYADRVKDWPPERIRTAGHCCKLGTLSAEALDPLLKSVAHSGIGVVSLPVTNLYLQGRDHLVRTPRGLTALSALLAAGIPLAAGADNVRDPFNPIGRSDALETAALLIAAGHLDPRTAAHLVTDGARAVLGLPVAGPRPGAAAELLAVRGTGLLDVIAGAPADRLVLHRGAIVSISETTHRTAQFAATEVSVP